MEINAPAQVGADSNEPVFDRNGVRRSKDGRPYVKAPCPNADLWKPDEPPFQCIDGRIPGKRPGTTKQCPKCKGKGYVEKLYTRCTSFVGVLEARKNLEAWQRRVTLLGLAVDPLLWSDLLEADPDDRDRLDAIADRAFELGDGYAKAQKGTDLHLLSEYVDRDEPLPTELHGYDDSGRPLEPRPVTLQDRADMAAYVRVRDAFGLTFPELETFVVQDDYGIGGTFDRVLVSADPRLRCEVCDPYHCADMTRPKVFDLKTGRIDYGQGKIGQQLAVYANSRRYDPETGERSDLDVCPHRAFVMHLPQGTGTASLHSVDIVAGWADVAVSDAVRRHRRESKSWMTPLDSGLLLDYVRSA